MRRCLVIGGLLIMLLAACGPGRRTPDAMGENPQPQASPGLTGNAQGQPASGKCGDGTCGGPETTADCPLDCPAPAAGQATSPAPGQGQPTGDVPPLVFIYVIHTHVTDDWLPYTGPGLAQIDSQVASNMLAAIEGMQQVLDRYGVKASWQAVYGTAQGLCEYGGQDHIFRRLEAAGHEVAVHAHRSDDIRKAYLALTNDCGMSPVVSSGHLIEAYRLGQAGGAQAAQEAMASSLQLSSQLGLTVITENLSPGSAKSIFAETCNNQFGVGNDMWDQTGNLMFPWRPDYENQDICAHNPQGDILSIDHVSIEVAIDEQSGDMPDVWGPEQFEVLRRLFDGALSYMQTEKPEGVAVWGFVTHIVEYAEGSKGENPPDAAALAALDTFLAYVDSMRSQGRVVYATPGEIAEFIGR